MCNTCFRHHLKGKFCRNHVLVTIGDLPSVALKSREEDIEKCKKHNNEAIKFYCRTHDTVGCGDCIIFEHKTCEPEYIKDLAKTFRKDDKFKQLFEKLDRMESIKKESEERLEKNKKEIDLLTNKALKEIRQFRSDINEYFDKTETEIILEVTKITSENNELQRKLEQDLTTLINDTEEVKQKLNAHHLSSNVSFIQAITCKPTIETIEKAYQQIKHETALNKIEFVPGEKISEILQSAYDFGRLRVHSGSGLESDLVETQQQQNNNSDSSVSTGNIRRGSSRTRNSDWF